MIIHETNFLYLCLSYLRLRTFYDLLPHTLFFTNTLTLHLSSFHIQSDTYKAMDAGVTKSLLSRTSTLNISVGLQHKQSKLDLLDNKTLTSFPLPNINENTTNHCGSGRVNSVGTVDSLTSSTNTFHGPKRWKSSILFGEYKNYNKSSNGVRIDRNSPMLRSRTASSIQTIDSMGNILINSSERIKYSLTDSMTSRTAMGSSKTTTPPSSVDYESTFYDYRLVLEQSEKKGNRGSGGNNVSENKHADVMTRTECSATIENSKNTDIYIQSLYQELMEKDESRRQIQCMVCDLPVFEDDEYFNRILDFKGVVCENCLRNHDSNLSTTRKIEKNMNMEESLDLSPSPVDDIYSSMDETNHTIQLQLDTTIQSEEDTTEYGIYGNIDFFRNDDTENRNHFCGMKKTGDDNFGKIIRRLRRIERTDLRLRQSIADLRSGSEGFNEYDSFWNTLKSRFLNSRH